MFMIVKPHSPSNIEREGPESRIVEAIEASRLLARGTNCLAVYEGDPPEHFDGKEESLEDDPAVIFLCWEGWINRILGGLHPDVAKNSFGSLVEGEGKIVSEILESKLVEFEKALGFSG